MELVALPASARKAFLRWPITRLVQENYLGVGAENLPISLDFGIAISINV